MALNAAGRDGDGQGGPGQRPGPVGRWRGGTPAPSAAASSRGSSAGAAARPSAHAGLSRAAEQGPEQPSWGLRGTTPRSGGI